MTGRLVGAIPNLPAAGVVVPSLRVVLPVAPSPDPAAGVPPALVVLLLGAAGGPHPCGFTQRSGIGPPGLLNQTTPRQLQAFKTT
jgi:hypothetical protein